MSDIIDTQEKLDIKQFESSEVTNDGIVKDLKSSTIFPLIIFTECGNKTL